MFTYAVTAKKTRSPISEQHYIDFLNYITDLGEVGNVNYETTRGLHVHFVLKTKTRLDYNKLKPTRYGWSVRAVPVYDINRWIQYCEKDRPVLTEGQSRALRRRMISLSCCNNNDIQIPP